MHGLPTLYLLLPTLMKYAHKKQPMSTVTTGTMTATQI